MCRGSEPDALRRPVLGDAHRSQSSFALALHPPAAQQGDRPDGPPSPEDCPFPRQAEIFTAAVQEHVAAFLLPWAVALQTALQFGNFLSARRQLRLGTAGG